MEYQKISSILTRIHLRVEVWKKEGYGMFDFGSDKDKEVVNVELTEDFRMILIPQKFQIGFLPLKNKSEKFDLPEIIVKIKEKVIHLQSENSNISNTLWRRVEQPI